MTTLKTTATPDVITTTKGSPAVTTLKPAIPAIQHPGTYQNKCEADFAPESFGSGSVTLTVADKANLNSVIGLIRPGAAVTIKGYASAGGSAAFNLALSQSRANSVKQYVLAALAVKHVVAGSVSAIGYGVSPLGRVAVITKL